MQQRVVRVALMPVLGSALLIDYGPKTLSFGDTFRAFRGHAQVDVLSQVEWTMTRMYCLVCHMCCVAWYG